MAEVALFNGAVVVALRGRTETQAKRVVRRQLLRPLRADVSVAAKLGERFGISGDRVRQRYEVTALLRGDAGFYAGHERGGQCVALAGALLFDHAD